MEFMSALGSQEDAYRPSLFELVAQEKLRELIQPAVQYAVAIYAQRYPRLLIRVVNNHEEFYALMMLLVERHYLKEWGASFAENFYGLKRAVVPRTTGKGSAPMLDALVNSQPTVGLSQRDIKKSLLVLVGLPYVKCRLDLLYQQVSGGASASLFGDNEREDREVEELQSPDTTPLRKLTVRLVRLFRKIYPYLNGLFHVTNLVYNIAYLFGKTRYYSPWLHLIGQEVKRMSMEDYRAYYSKSSTAQQGTSLSSLFTSPGRTFALLFSKLIEFLKVLLPMSIFFFKFLEWWYSSEFARGGHDGTTGEAGSAVPPPEITKPDPRGTPLPTTPNTCPLCLSKPINNPTALPSGYVYCYTCVYHYVEDHGRCPVTWVKVSRGTQGLTKVYAEGGL